MGNLLSHSSLSFKGSLCLALVTAPQAIILASILADRPQGQLTGLAVGAAILSLPLAAGLLWWQILRPCQIIAEACKAAVRREPVSLAKLESRRDGLGDIATALGVMCRAADNAERLETAHQEARSRAGMERSRALRQTAERFESDVKGVVDHIADMALTMHAISEAMSSAATDTSLQTAQVAGAAAEASDNVGTVAATANELSASINEISRQVSQSSHHIQDAVKATQTTRSTVERLDKAAIHISEILTLINSIAAQTNLLALNATIEAARAGDAGKGFAVVANEVKLLATQTARATGEIDNQIREVQAATRDTITAFQEIIQAVDEIGQLGQATADAVSQQRQATAGIARSVDAAASGTRMVCDGILHVDNTARETGQAAGQVLVTAEEMSHNASILLEKIAAFLANVTEKSGEAVKQAVRS